MENVNLWVEIEVVMLESAAFALPRTISRDIMTAVFARLFDDMMLIDRKSLLTSLVTDMQDCGCNATSWLQVGVIVDLVVIREFKFNDPGNSKS